MTKDKQTKVERIVSCMPMGRENAVPMRYIAVILNMSEREVRSAVNEARLAGHMIIGDDFGYYLPETDGELLDYYFRLRSHANTTQSVLDVVLIHLLMRGVNPDDKGGVPDAD